jgi:hypothetical protein
MALVIYTAITQGYDTLRPVAPSCRPGAEFVAFLEHAGRVEPWEVRPLERHTSDPVRDAKPYKILPHQYFPDHSYSLWLDGKMELKAEFSVKEMLDLLQDADLVAFEHALRCCLYQEACQCIHRRMDEPHLIYHQIERYTREGFPANQGLVDCAVLLRRHNAATEEFSRLWWREIEQGSRRDQLSFMYCAWKCGLKYRYFTGYTHENPFFRQHEHLRRRVAPAPAPILSDSAPQTPTPGGR